MKIIVLNNADLRIDVISVSDFLIGDGIEEFLAEHGYSLNNTSWMAAPIDYVPVQFHFHTMDEDTNEEVKTTSNARLCSSIYDSREDVKRREREALREALRKYGKHVDSGYEHHFNGECPVIAAYNSDEPCDVVILAVKMDKEGYLTILAEEKLDRTYTFELDPDNIFAGQLEYVTSELGAANEVQGQD